MGYMIDWGGAELKDMELRRERGTTVVQSFEFPLLCFLVGVRVGTAVLNAWKTHTLGSGICGGVCAPYCRMRIPFFLLCLIE